MPELVLFQLFLSGPRAVRTDGGRKGGEFLQLIEQDLLALLQLLFPLFRKIGHLKFLLDPLELVEDLRERGFLLPKNR